MKITDPKEIKRLNRIDKDKHIFCTHDGWAMFDGDMVLHEGEDSFDNIVSLQCNALSCLVKQKFIIDIVNVRKAP